MEKFKYRVEVIDWIPINNKEISPDYSEDLKKLGENGWELVGVILANNFGPVKGYFKKVVISTENDSNKEMD